MSRPSSILRLPAEAREALDAWLRDPAITRTEATKRTNALLAELGISMRVSRPAVNRYNLRLRAVGEKLRQSRQVAEAWVARLGSAPEGRLGPLIIEMLRTLAFDLALRLQDSELDAETLPGVVAAASKVTLMAERLERTSEISARRERQLKREAAEELAAQAAQEQRAGRNAGPERLREIIQEIYGV